MKMLIDIKRDAEGPIMVLRESLLREAWPGLVRHKDLPHRELDVDEWMELAETEGVHIGGLRVEIVREGK